MDPRCEEEKNAFKLQSLNGIRKVYYFEAVSYPPPPPPTHTHTHTHSPSLSLSSAGHTAGAHLVMGPLEVWNTRERGGGGGGFCKGSAPPGSAVLTGRWFCAVPTVGLHQKCRRGRTGQADRVVVVGEEKMCFHPPLLSLHPDPTLLHLRVSLP